jgi:hypothetical protein
LGRRHTSWQTSQALLLLLLLLLLLQQLTSWQHSSSSSRPRQLVLLRRQVVLQRQMAARLTCMVPLAAPVVWRQHWLLRLPRSRPRAQGQLQRRGPGAVATSHNAMLARAIRQRLW